MANSSENIIWHPARITQEDRKRKNGHSGAVIWFTGLSGSGKSTLANELEFVLHKNNIQTYVLDGDNIRHGLNRDLGFSPEDRKENIRRIGETARLFCDAGVIVITAFISPYQDDRQAVRSLFHQNEFIEIYVQASLEICRKRDPKGLYLKADSGEISDFTGVSAPYEEPERPELVINTDQNSPEEAVRLIIDFLRKAGRTEFVLN